MTRGGCGTGTHGCSISSSHTHCPPLPTPVKGLAGSYHNLFASSLGPAIFWTSGSHQILPGLSPCHCWEIVPPCISSQPSLKGRSKTASAGDAIYGGCALQSSQLDQGCWRDLLESRSLQHSSVLLDGLSKSILEC